MNKILITIIEWGVISILSIAFVSFLWFVLIEPDLIDNELCADRMEVGYSRWHGFINASEGLRHESIDNNHFNCCWDEVALNEQGYYVGTVCNGFKLNID